VSAHSSRFVPFGLILLVGAALAQTASLTGTITGIAGAPVPNATVTARNAATGQSVATRTDAAGAYSFPNLAPGDYEITVSAEGLTRTEKVTIAAGVRQTLPLSLAAAGAPSLSDLGFSPGQTAGSAQEQARLDKRSHMLKTHQRLGLITLAPLVATLITSNNAANRHTISASGRELHAALGSVTAGLYLTTASFAIFAPKIPNTKVRGPIKLHRALAFVHGSGMILTPILGALAYEQRSKGERIHGIAQAHAPVAIVTAAAYGLAILSVSIKF
jgi:Carboxypeptidase regulatory-like domain